MSSRFLDGPPPGKDKVVHHWVPDNNDGHYDLMPGDFFYISDKEWFDSNKKEIDVFLYALFKIRMITGHCFIASQGLYIDARLPAQYS